MALLPLGSKRTPGSEVPIPVQIQGTLESGVQKKVRSVTRTFLFQNVLLSRDSRDEDILLLDFELQRVDVPESGKNQNSGNGSLLLRFKALGKEISLFSGLLGRQVTFEEERKDLVSEETRSELQQLRDLVSRLETENQALKQCLMEIQRPRRMA